MPRPPREKRSTTTDGHVEVVSKNSNGDNSVDFGPTTPPLPTELTGPATAVRRAGVDGRTQRIVIAARIVRISPESANTAVLTSAGSRSPLMRVVRPSAKSTSTYGSPSVADTPRRAPHTT